ncbi:hypothetical protein ACFWRZ_24805 [Streptomyces rubiginosohelvolus]|uniref:hypothetical protein n=1 Tax=Streptomyces rubiginosohelvolus TaxID=67362 RepID=UPI003662E00A
MTSVEATGAAQPAPDEGEPLSEAEEQLVERALDVMAAVVGRPADELELDNLLAGDLGCDEVAAANIAMALETELDLDGLFEEVEDWETVDDVLESVLYCAEGAADDVATG